MTFLDIIATIDTMDRWNSGHGKLLSKFTMSDSARSILMSAKLDSLFSFMVDRKQSFISIGLLYDRSTPAVENTDYT